MGRQRFVIHDEGVSESRISIVIHLVSLGGQRVIPNKALRSGFRIWNLRRTRIAPSVGK
jgi:hypothetical protein